MSRPPLVNSTHPLAASTSAADTPRLPNRRILTLPGTARSSTSKSFPRRQQLLCSKVSATLEVRRERAIEVELDVVLVAYMGHIVLND
jgi:hypothetical protein